VVGQIGEKSRELLLNFNFSVLQDFPVSIFEFYNDLAE
jgi:hypothetical protein